MKKFLLIACSLFFFWGQTQENHLDFFEPLMGRTWKAEGTWGDGSPFKQEIVFSYALGNTLVNVESKGYTDQERTQFGPRNHGVRKYDPDSKTIKFWEFDVFGGVTTGTVVAEGKNLRYAYAYGESTVTDLWEYVNDNAYNFKVGDYQNGEWKQVYLSTQFIAEPKKDLDFQFDHQSLVVTNLMKTGDFYRDVFNFEEIPHPEGKPGFRWFTIYDNSQLHLIKKDMVEFKKDKSIHLCLSLQNLEAFIEKLIAKDIAFYDWPGNKGSVTDRADGVKQIYLQDPEGYWIEVNTAKH